MIQVNAARISFLDNSVGTKREVTLRHGLSLSLIAAAIASTGVAVADDNLKGSYASAGSAGCLWAPSGFTTDSNGNPTIPNGNTSYETTFNFQSRVVYNGNGTGEISGTYVGFTPPPPDSRAMPKAAMAAGTFSYSITYTPVSNNTFSSHVVPGT